MFIQLTMVTGDAEEIELEREGEDDGIVDAPAPRENTSPVMVNTDTIRNFYPRKKRRDGSTPAGTRITFINGSGMPVTETFDQVTAKLGRPN